MGSIGHAAYAEQNGTTYIPISEDIYERAYFVSTLITYDKYIVVMRLIRTFVPGQLSPRTKTNREQKNPDQIRKYQNLIECGFTNYCSSLHMCTCCFTDGTLGISYMLFRRCNSYLDTVYKACTFPCLIHISFYHVVRNFKYARKYEHVLGNDVDIGFVSCSPSHHRFPHVESS